MPITRRAATYNVDLRARDLEHLRDLAAFFGTTQAEVLRWAARALHIEVKAARTAEAQLELIRAYQRAS